MADIVLGVAIEEMIHMTIAANLLIALGGVPAIDTPAFVPTYPGSLPMGVGGLSVHLKKCSIPQIRDVYMAIEEPNRPLVIPSAATPDGVVIEAPGTETIGDFYNHIAAKIKTFGDAAFTGDFSKVVVSLKWFPDENDMFRITDTASALRAIDVIVDQGEGSSVDPFDHDGYPAHFYRFEQIVQGNELIHRPGETPPYAFAGASVPFDAYAVWDMDDDPKVEKYAPGSRSRELAAQFSHAYTALLKALHRTFDGDPEYLDTAMGMMQGLTPLAQQVLAEPAQWADPAVTLNKQTGLCFQHMPGA